MKKFLAQAAVLSFILTAIIAPQDANAQEGVRFADDARYLRIVYVSYKPGKAAEAYGIINDHFQPAGQAIGLPGPVVIHMQTGQFDAAFFWRLDDGTEDLEWRITPEGARFRQSLAAREGGDAAAQALMDRYNGLISRTVTVVGHRHVPEDKG